jgi:DNA-binding transcriptional ArsR family regulator
MATEEDTYNIIFKAMQHPIRRRILRTLSEAPSTYTEIQKALNIDNGLLNYHLDSMKDLITKNSEEKYTLSEFGRVTVNLVRGVEEPANTLPSRSGISALFLNKLLVACFIIIALASAAVTIDMNGRYTNLSEKYYTQGLQLNQLQGEYSKLSESVKSINYTLVASEEAYFIRESIRLSLSSLFLGGRLTYENGTIIILSNGPVANIVLPKVVNGIKLLALTQDEIDAKRAVYGPFLYLEIKEITVNNERAFVSLRSTGVFDAGGGCGVTFWRRDGIWNSGEVTSAFIA